MADDYRQRCADAAMNAWSMHAVVCDHSQTIPVGNLVDAVLAVRDQDAETLRSDNEELRKRVDAADAEVARLRAGEAPEPPAPHVPLTPAEWLRKMHDATPEKRLHVIEVLLGEVDRGSRCFQMNHEGVIEDLRAELARASGLRL